MNALVLILRKELYYKRNYYQKYPNNERVHQMADIVIRLNENEI